MALLTVQVSEKRHSEGTGGAKPTLLAPLPLVWHRVGKRSRFDEAETRLLMCKIAAGSHLAAGGGAD